MLRAPSCKNVAFSRLSNSDLSLFHVGWVHSAHGIQGQVYIHLKAKTADWFREGQSFYIGEISKQRDFKVMSARPHKHGLLVQLVGISDRNQAEALKKLEVWISKDQLVTTEAETPFLLELLGFEVCVEGESVGVVSGFSSNGAQDLLEVQRAGKVLGWVPFVSPLVVEIDRKKRCIVMSLPEGLLGDGEESL